MHASLPTLPPASFGLLTGLLAHRSLVAQLVRRAIAERYRGSLLGVLWSLINPLLMLGVYAFVFGTVLRGRGWGETGIAIHGLSFAVVLFAGLIIVWLFSDIVTRAPRLVLSNRNYVRKVVFPLEVLPLVALGASLVQAGVNLAVLLVFRVVAMGGLPWTVVLVPLAIGPLVLLLAGVGWLLASLGVYVRDITQLTGPLIAVLMFLGPIFYPLDALPESLRPLFLLNPLTVPVEAMRDVVVWGRPPDWTALGAYTLAALGVLALGRLWFEKTRKGFADVL